MCEQPLLFNYYLIHHPFLTPLVPHHPQYSDCVAYGALCRVICYQMLPTQG